MSSCFLQRKDIILVNAERIAQSAIAFMSNMHKAQKFDTDSKNNNIQGKRNSVLYFACMYYARRICFE